MRLSRKASIALSSSLIAGFFLLTFLASAWSRRAGESGKPSSVGADDASHPPRSSGSVILSNFHRSETKEGKKQWELFADGGEYSPAGGTISVSNSRLTLFRADGTSVLMTAPASTIEISGQDLKSAVSTGGVVITYSEGLVIKTEETTYDKGAGTVHAPHHVVIEGESGVTEGDWLRGEVATKVVNLGGNIKTRINPRPTPSAPSSSEQPSQPAPESEE